jgi:hypothetical protein
MLDVLCVIIIIVYLCTGAKFFPGFLTDKRRAALDAAALEWQAEGKQQLNSLARVSMSQDQALLLAPPAGSWGPCASVWREGGAESVCVRTQR